MTTFQKALFLGLSLIVVVATAQKPQGAYDSALQCIEQGRLKLAATILAREAPRQPSVASAEYFALLGSVYEDQGYLISAHDAYVMSRRLAVQQQNNKIEARALNGIARFNVAQGNYDSVLYYLSESRELDTSTENAIAAKQAEGKYWQAQNQYDKALSALQSALDAASGTADKNSRAIILSNMGSIYFSHDPDMQVALGFYKRSNQLGDTLRPSVTLIRNYCRMTNSYMVLGDHENAARYLNRASQLTENSEYLTLKAYVLSTRVILLAEQGHIAQAAELSDEPIRIKREIGDKRQLQNDLLNVAELRMTIGQYDQAERLLSEGIAISHSLHDLVYLKYFYNRRSQLDSIRGNYLSAYENLKKSFMYKDSTFSVDHLRAVNEIREKYEAEQKEKIIAEKELQIEEQKYQRAIILGIFSVVVLILVVILLLIRSRSRTKLQQEKQVRLRTIVQTQEDVQQRIARDLHDGLVQVLAAAQLSLESVRDDSNAALLRKQMQLAYGIMEEALTEARSISHQILPYSLLKGGLVEALEELLSRSFENYTFQRPVNELTLNEGEAINVYRIVQELVNNVRKHAGATTVSVILSAGAHEVRLIFEDDGVGFSMPGVRAGIGLSNMTTRAELIGGTISFRPGISKGTSVELILPR